MGDRFSYGRSPSTHRSKSKHATAQEVSKQALPESARTFGSGAKKPLRMLWWCSFTVVLQLSQAVKCQFPRSGSTPLLERSEGLALCAWRLKLPLQPGASNVSAQHSPSQYALTDCNMSFRMLWLDGAQALDLNEASDRVQALGLTASLHKPDMQSLRLWSVQEGRAPKVQGCFRLLQQHTSPSNPFIRQSHCLYCFEPTTKPDNEEYPTAWAPRSAGRYASRLACISWGGDIFQTLPAESGR